MPRPTPGLTAPRRDIGRLLSQILCALFALIGSMPIAAAALVRSAPAQDWAARQTARILQEELGVDASYGVELSLFPIELVISDLVVRASDGGTPALRTPEIRVTPRLFSLLAGKLDVGDIDIERPVARLVIRNGKLSNVRYRLKKSRGGDRLERAPFTSLAVSDGTLKVDAEGLLVESSAVDADILAEPGMSFEIALRLAEASAVQRRGHAKQAQGVAATAAIDEDAICRLDLRVHAEPGELTLRRMSLLGVADSKPAGGTRPNCQRAMDKNDGARVLGRVSSLRVRFRKGQFPALSGHVAVQLPAMLANRYLDTLPFHGWAGFSGDLSYDGTTRLPRLSGKATGKDLAIDKYVVAHEFTADVDIAGDVVRIPRFRMDYADADVQLENARIRPFEPGVPISAERVENRHLLFPGLMRDLAVTPNTIVKWDLDRATVTEIEGTLSPLLIDAKVDSDTSNFEVTNRAFHDPTRKRMIGVKKAKVKGRIRVTPKAFQLLDTRATFGKSSVLVQLMSIGFDNDLELVVPESAKLDLSDISPLAGIPIAGKANLDTKMSGPAKNPVLTGHVSIDDFHFDGFPLGDVQSSNVRFVPLKVDIDNLVAKKGRSTYRSAKARLDFDTGAHVRLTGMVSSQAMDLRDFLALWKFENDPRWTHLKGKGAMQARVDYVFGGPNDRCGHGSLRVVGSTDMAWMEAFDEHYDGGLAEFDFRWEDIEASYYGFSLDIPSFSLKKGDGTFAGSFEMRPGAVLSGRGVGSAIPISKIDALGDRVQGVTGSVTTAVGEMSGTLDELKMNVTASLSEMHLGGHTLPPSEFSVSLEPTAHKPEIKGTTRCGQPIPGAFDEARWAKDEVRGHFHVAGQLFGGQARFKDLLLTQQRSKSWMGSVDLEGFDLGAVKELFAPGTLPDFGGNVSGRVELANYYIDRPAESELSFKVSEFQATNGGLQAALVQQEGKATRIELGQRELSVQDLRLSMKAPGGQSGVFDVHGRVQNLGKSPEVHARLNLLPADLSAFTAFIPGAEKASGKLGGELLVSGPVAALRYEGGLKLTDGTIQLERYKTPITELNLDVEVNPQQIRVTRGTARVGTGKLELTGNAPIRGTSLGTARAELKVRDLSLALDEGVHVRVDSRLRATYDPNATAGPGGLPQITGQVVVTDFDYTRPMSMTADIATFAKKGQRTHVDSYDPNEDSVQFDVQLTSKRPFRIKNELIKADLVVGEAGLRLKGTNQRFGMLGRVKFKPGGQIKLRSHEFEIRQGWVRFQDLTQISPEVDVTAVTEYRRFKDTAQENSTSSAASSNGSSSSLGGQWRINLHAYGDPEDLKIDLSSTPNLRQDDIFLLLTVGLTRAELDQSRSAAVGSSVALEALGTLSGADTAVKDAVPVIDEAAMGSAYNPRSGRTEPTITIGKQLAERIRAQVTTGLSDTSEVNGRLRMQINPQVSLEGSYGNVNDISSSPLGNVGADIRWRLEFD